jgi:biotin carboxyl carrier protein
MTFEIEVNGRTRTVAVEAVDAAGADGGLFRLRIDGAAYEVDARATDLGLSLTYADSGRAADVAITERAAGEVLLQLPRAMVTALVDARRYRRTGGGHVTTSGEQRIAAPMPGRIIRVLVSPGDEVEARQGLVVVEAMKMENEISATRPGRVKEVAVSEGQSVESGRLLVVVE